MTHFLRSLVAVLVLSLFPFAAQAAEPENTLVISLKDGDVTIALRPDLAPRHVERITPLARQGAAKRPVAKRIGVGLAFEDEGNVSVALATLLASSACGNKAPELVTSAKPDTALPSLADLHAPDAQASGPDAQATGHDAQAADGQPNSVGEPTRPAAAIAVEAMHPILSLIHISEPTRPY